VELEVKCHHEYHKETLHSPGIPAHLTRATYFMVKRQADLLCCDWQLALVCTM